MKLFHFRLRSASIANLVALVTPLVLGTASAGQDKLQVFSTWVLVNFSQEEGDPFRQVIQNIYKEQIEIAGLRYPGMKLQIAIGSPVAASDLVALFKDHPFFCSGGDCKLVLLRKQGNEWVEVLETMSNGVFAYTHEGTDVVGPDGRSISAGRTLCIERTKKTMEFVWVPHKYELKKTYEPGKCAFRK